MLVILDIDGLLVQRTRKTHRQTQTENSTELMIAYLQGDSVTFEGLNNYYTTRAGLRPFLDRLFAEHSVAIWTSSTDVNSSDVLNYILHPWERQQLVFFWNREHTVLDPDFPRNKTKAHDTIKPIHNVFTHPAINSDRKWHKDNTVLIDDEARKLRKNPPSTRITVTNFTDSLDEILDGLAERE